MTAPTPRAPAASETIAAKHPHETLFGSAMDALRAINAAAVEHERITNDEHGLLIAQAIALRADCTRRRVGVLLVDIHGRTVGTGRNGAPPGRPGCLSAGACPRGRLSYDQVPTNSAYGTGAAGECCAVHAEINALLYSDPMARRGGTAYITCAPCDDCSKHIAASGLARVVWPEPTPDGGWEARSYEVDTSPIGGYLR